jgi:small subunit ribosomal protein S9
MVKKADSQTKKAPVSTLPRARYFAAVGRRKTAVARIRVSEGNGGLSVNGKDGGQYFRIPTLLQIAVSPLARLNLSEKFSVSAVVHGGGSHAQAEAVRLGISRALVRSSADFKKTLRGLGFMTRDSRMVERKKYGLKKARRAPQWQKR